MSGLEWLKGDRYDVEAIEAPNFGIPAILDEGEKIEGMIVEYWWGRFVEKEYLTFQEGRAGYMNS